MIEIEQWGKMIIWLWSRYIKKKLFHILISNSIIPCGCFILLVEY